MMTVIFADIEYSYERNLTARFQALAIPRA
jgi:hypothetical protein